ncbi:MAG: hypothetical protein ABSF81_07755 [Bacteroidales bacterium]
MLQLWIRRTPDQVPGEILHLWVSDLANTVRISDQIPGEILHLWVRDLANTVRISDQVPGEDTAVLDPSIYFYEKF